MGVGHCAGPSRKRPEGLWCKRPGPVDYAGKLNRERPAMGKLEGLEELLAGRHFDREAIILHVR